MDEVIPRNPTIIRKSAFGRTSLFIPSASTLLREVQCMGGVSRHDNVSIYHMHDTSKNKKIDCWHCCESFDWERIQIPRLYDPVEQVYHVYGHFCSVNCGKAYILENSTYDRGQHLNVFVKMLRDVYGITKKVIEAPPRVSLQKFGGPFNINEFRDMKNICTVNKPPFVSYCMVVEERSATKATDKHELFEMNSDNCVEKDTDISEVPTKPLYNDFLKEKEENETKDVVVPIEKVEKVRGRKRKEPVAQSVNTLASYS